MEIDDFFGSESQLIIDAFHATKQRMAAADGGALTQQPKITIIHDNVLHCADTLRSADIVVFFNPFEQISSIELGRKLLLFFAREVVRPGVIIVSVPEMTAIYERAECTMDLVIGRDANCVDMGRWIRELGSCEDIFVYEVLRCGVA